MDIYLAVNTWASWLVPINVEVYLTLNKTLKNIYQSEKKKNK